MGPNSFPKSLRRDALIVEGPEAEGPEISPSEAEIHLTIEAEPLTGFRQLAKQIRQYPTDHAFDLNEGINHSRYFQEQEAKGTDSEVDKKIEKYLSHPTFGLSGSLLPKNFSKSTKISATEPKQIAQKPTQIASKPEKLEMFAGEASAGGSSRSQSAFQDFHGNPKKLLRTIPINNSFEIDETSALPFFEKDQKRTLESLFPVKPFVSKPERPSITNQELENRNKAKSSVQKLSSQKTPAQQNPSSKKPTLIRFVSPFQMTSDTVSAASDHQTFSRASKAMLMENLTADNLTLDNLNDALSQQFNQRITAKPLPEGAHRLYSDFSAFDTLTTDEPHELENKHEFPLDLANLNLSQVNNDIEPESSYIPRLHALQESLLGRLAEFKVLSNPSPVSQPEAKTQEPEHQALSSPSLVSQPEAKSQEPEPTVISSPSPVSQPQAKIQESEPQALSSPSRVSQPQVKSQEPEPTVISSPSPVSQPEATLQEPEPTDPFAEDLQQKFKKESKPTVLRDQFLTKETLIDQQTNTPASSELMGLDDSGLDLVLANALLEQALPPPMGTPAIHQRIQDQIKAMDFSNIYRQTEWKHLPAAAINPTEFFDPDLLDELDWAYAQKTAKPSLSKEQSPFSHLMTYQPITINYDEASAIMQFHLADLQPDTSIQIDTNPKKLAPNSRFSDTLSPKMEQGSFVTQKQGCRGTAPSHPENFVIRGVKLKEIRSMGGNMSNLSGYKDLSKAPAAFGEEEKNDLGQSPFHAGPNSLAASFGPAPGLNHEAFAPAEMPATQVAETDYNSNFQTLIRLINELPEGVTKQTGAQIIRLTMESMGIFMEDVLSDAQAAQSEMLDAVRANIKKIEEYKTVIRKLETDIKYYQTKANELSEIIDLFILSNTAGKSGLD